MKKLIILILLVFIAGYGFSAEFNKALLESLKGEMITSIQFKNSDKEIGNYMDAYMKITEITDSYILVEVFNKKSNKSVNKYYILIEQISIIRIYKGDQ